MTLACSLTASARCAPIKRFSKIGERTCNARTDETSPLLRCQSRNVIRPAQRQVKNTAEKKPDKAMIVPPCHVSRGINSVVAAVTTFGRGLVAVQVGDIVDKVERVLVGVGVVVARIKGQIPLIRTKRKIKRE